MSQRVECGDCDWQGTADQIDIGDIEDLCQRIDPGSEVPAGECPECGALAYVLRSDNDYNAFERKLIDCLKAVVHCQNYSAPIHPVPLSAEFAQILNRCSDLIAKWEGTETEVQS